MDKQLNDMYIFDLLLHKQGTIDTVLIESYFNNEELLNSSSQREEQLNDFLRKCNR